MGSAVLEMPKGVCPNPVEVGTIGAFYEPSVAPEKKLIHSDQQLIRSLVKEIDKQLLDLLDSRSPDEFYQVRDKAWPRYIRALTALLDTAANLVPNEDHVTEGILAHLSADLDKQGATLGPQLLEQSIFTLWMMPKIRSVAIEISRAGDPPDKSADDILLREYLTHSLWAQLHLDAIFAAVKFNRPIREAIWEPMCNGLRASVNAYAVAKDALYLRRPPVEEVALEGLPWDAEDDELLASSMGDDAESAERH
jgi:hypothetical protein